MKKNTLCMNCFKIKGDYEVCPHCGYIEGTPPSQSYFLEPGTILENRYIIGTCIGFGGFGITYHAYDMVLNIQVAVKEFYPAGLVNRAPGDIKIGVFSGEKEKEFGIQLERFLDEARNMAIFSKERDIVNVYHFFEANGTAYTIMEYIDKILLKKYLKENGKMEVEDAVSYMLPILDALEKIHRQGIIHKDISPDNIFLTGKGSVKIFDFGAARFPGGQRDKNYSVVIKPGYAPPEQYQSDYEPGAYMDIYAAGAVFYEMVTGVKPSEGSDRAIEDDLQFPSRMGVKIDRNLEKIIMKALAVKPEQRFQTAAEFKDCIEKNTAVLLPEEEAKKLEHQKAVRIGVGAAAAAAAVIGITAGVFSYLGRNQLHPNKLKEDTVSVWLPVEEGSGLADMLRASFAEDCPAITLDITEIPEDEYEERLLAACEDGTLPDVFRTDGLPGDAREYCGSTQKLLHTLDMEDYPYLGQLEESAEVPTGLQMAVIYENVEKFQSQGDKADERMTQELLSQIPQEERAVLGSYDKFGDGADRLRVIAGDLSCFEQVQDVTVKAVPSVEFSAAPLLDDKEKLLAVFCENYGVNKNSSKNRQEAGMTCIFYLLSDSLQEEAYLDNYRAVPIQKDAQEAYAEVKFTGYLGFVEDYLDRLSVSQGNSSVGEAYYGE